MLIINAYLHCSKQFIDKGVTYYGDIVMLETGEDDIVMAYRGWRFVYCLHTDDITLYKPAVEVNTSIKVRGDHVKVLPSTIKYMDINITNINLIAYGLRRDVFVDGECHYHKGLITSLKIIISNYVDL